MYATKGFGEAAWKLVTDGQVITRLSLITREAEDESLLLFSTDKATVYAVNSRSGKVAWKHTAAEGTLQGPVVQGDTAYVTQERTLYVLDTAGPRWES